MADLTLIPVLSNPSARGGGGRPMSSITRALRFAGRSPAHVSARSPDEVTERLRELIVAGEERVLLIGGDGLVHHAAQAAVNSPLTLGIVPTGTGNDVARGLSIPTNVAGAVGTALIDQVAIDVLRVRELPSGEPRIVVSVCTLGFSGDVNARANRLRRPRGRFRYSAATMLELKQLRALSLSIELDDEPAVAIESTLMAIANTPFFGGGMMIAPKADPTDGILDICCIGKVGRFELLRVFPRVFRGKHLSHRAVSTHRAERVVIRQRDGDESVAVWGDGEPIGNLPVEITVVAASLPVAGARVFKPGAPIVKL
ncbi:MAG TPA: diacylglycerol kinase family protein [Acidimicrobiales bacterium]|nr:diacylglycerol kinase family protein [Acidimicrobiales bacterium]